MGFRIPLLLLLFSLLGTINDTHAVESEACREVILEQQGETVTKPDPSPQRRRFATVKKEHSLDYPTPGPLGDLFMSRKANVLVKKYKTKDPEKTAWAVARLHRAVESLISSSEALSQDLQLLPILEVGRDFIVKEHFNLGTQPERMGDDNPDKPDALATLNRVQRRLKSCCDVGQDLAKEVLSQTLAFGSEHVFWSFKHARLVIPDLLITEEQLNDTSFSSVEPLENGSLIIGHQPKLKNLKNLKAAGFTHVVTLLKESEGARRIGREVEAAGMNWLWLPLASGKIPETKGENEEYLRSLPRLKHVFQSKTPVKIYLHCSAGLHRTGMMTYLLLRSFGYSVQETAAFMMNLRPITFMELGRKGREWAERLLANQSSVP